MSAVVAEAEEVAATAAHARALRAEQHAFAAEALRAKAEGRYADAYALEVSKWSCCTEAARIERALRGLG